MAHSSSVKHKAYNAKESKYSTELICKRSTRIFDHNVKHSIVLITVTIFGKLVCYDKFSLNIVDQLRFVENCRDEILHGNSTRCACKAKWVDIQSVQIAPKKMENHTEANIETKLKRRRRKRKMMMIKIVRIDQKLISAFALLFITRFVRRAVVRVCVFDIYVLTSYSFHV